jgi:putative aldouronate transport system substrate-binding protein
MKRTLSVILALVLALSMTAAFADDNFNATGYPIATEPVTYTGLVSHSSQYADDYNEYLAIKYWTELTNIQFEWQYINGSDWDVQIGLRLAAHDIPDFIYSPLSTTLLQQYGVEGGYFLDYNKYIDEYMPNLKAAIEKDPDLGAYGTMLDGGMYQLPRKLWTYTMANPLYYRGDMLAQLGIEAPKTIDEFYDALVLAKETFADVEGFVPYETMPNIMHLDLFGAFGDAWQVGFGDNGDGKVTCNYATEQWRRYLEFANKLYTEKLVDEEMFTFDAATMNAKIKAGQCMFIGNNGTQLTAQHYASGTVETKVLAPLTSEFTDEPKIVDISWGGWSGRAINADCENPEYLLRYFDMFFTEIGQAEINVCGVDSWLGVKGENWDLSEDGQNYYRILPEGNTMAEEEYKNKYVIDSTYIGLIVLDVFPINNPTQEMKAYESAESYYPYMKYRLTDGDFKYTEEENADLAGYLTDLNNYINTSTAQFITGTVELNDDTWQDYLNNLEKMGLSEVVELKQTGYDRWKGEA